MFTRRGFGKLALGAGAVSLATPLRYGRAADRPVLTIAVDNLWQTMSPINGLSTTSNRIFPNFYEALIEAHQGLTSAESHAFNARLVLVLANHVGLTAVLRQAFEAAASAR